jgi:DNA-binding LacI/PurR family transcriptional regulator
MRVTLKDIAAKVGVTKMTVSLALRGNPSISVAMRETIKRVAGEMGYVADPVLQRLAAYRRSQKTEGFRSVIGWLNHWEEPGRLRGFHEFEEYWRGAGQATRRLGYQLEECIWPMDCSALRTEQILVNRGILGLLIPPHKPEVDWGGFNWSRFSLIRFGLSVRSVDTNLVTADHQRAMVMGITRIRAYGYQRIGLVYNVAHDYSMGGNHYGGFIWANKSLGIEHPIPPLDSEMKTPALAARTRRQLAAWMKKYRPDAIMTAAPEVPRLLQELGYRIPDDVAVASTSASDALVDAGIDQCSNTIGQIAAEMLIKQISLNERGEPADPYRILVESRWRDGQSLPLRRQTNNFTVTAKR